MSYSQRAEKEVSCICTLHSLVEVSVSPPTTANIPPPPVVQTFCSHNVVGDNYIMMVDGGECLGLEETHQRDCRGKEIYVLSWKPKASPK